MVEMRNLMPNPWPTNANGWTTDGKDSAIELRMTESGDAIYTNIKSIANVDVNDLYICLQLPHIPAGDYVFGANITERSSFRRNRLHVVDRDGWKVIKSSSGSSNSIGYIAIPFTLTHDKGIQVRIQCGNIVGSTVFANELLLMTQKDWDIMRAIKNTDGTPANIRWFAPPKTAATGVLSVPALDRGGALLVLLAIIHTLMWRWQHDGDSESGARPGGHQATQPVADDVCGRLVHGRGNRRHTAKPDLRGKADPGGRHTGRTARIGYAGKTCRQRAGLVDTAALASHRHQIPARREHDQGQQQRALDQLQWPHLPGAYPRVGMVHARRLGALQNALDGRGAEQPALAPTGHGDRGLTTAASACAVTLTPRWEVAA